MGTDTQCYQTLLAKLSQNYVPGWKLAILSQVAQARSDLVKARALLSTYTVHVSLEEQKVLCKQSTVPYLHTHCSRYR